MNASILFKAREKKQRQSSVSTIDEGFLEEDQYSGSEELDNVKSHSIGVNEQEIINAKLHESEDIEHSEESSEEEEDELDLGDSDEMVLEGDSEEGNNMVIEDDDEEE